MAKKKQNYLKQKKSFSGAQILLFTLVFATVGAVAIWQSLAAPHGGGGKPKPGSGGSISLVMVTDQNSDGLPNRGDTVTFNISQTATTEPHVDLKCSQNGTVVYGATAGFYDSYPWPWTKNMTLSSQSWTGGAADCTVSLQYFSGSKVVVLATLNFHVNV
ncbi:hypothetical protein KW801_03040 [Candidatus Saccharibacteria bacterium]|nr:hypothetical protein [Candidatus Saccharibacteria bacterium]